MEITILKYLIADANLERSNELGECLFKVLTNAGEIEEQSVLCKKYNRYIPVCSFYVDSKKYPSLNSLQNAISLH